MDPQQEGGAPAWLFSFVDLAFLMLIAMTQVASDVGADTPDLGEIVVPRIGENGAEGKLDTGASRAWQLRIYPPSPAVDDRRTPFSLIQGEAGAEDVLRHDLESLRDEITVLLQGGAGKPLLAPHQDSRSQDLLDAVALLEEKWPTRRRALISRISER